MRVVHEKAFSMPNRIGRTSKLSLVGLLGALVFSSGTAHAQATVQRPMPNVLLLVDTSGSMERMADGTMPADNVGVALGGVPNRCNAGIESNPNRWGMLLQALTGNLQPFFSCAALDRSSGTSGAAFRNEYKINGLSPYDTDYALPYHRPLTGRAADNTTCAIGPNRLPGAAPGSGVGPSGGGYSLGFGSDVRDFPDDALVSAKWNYLQSQYASGNALGTLGSNACVFSQALDGQLDAARDYVRFALMTFDTDMSSSSGLSGGAWPPQGSINAANPFAGQWSYLRSASNPDYGLGALLSGAADGLPAGCAPPTQPFEVGARHYGAPPWEGRMIRFPAADASLFDVQQVNEQIQRVLLATRPYGATPIDGLMDDARDYLRYASDGPKDDPYVASKCRSQYMILLTDGAPNLDMRPTCQGPGGKCPYPSTAATQAAALFADPTAPITTYVIGFSVNGASGVGGNGFPTGYDAPPKNNCKAWYQGVGGTPTAMANACAATPPANGTAAAACCALNEIAYAGSGGATAGPNAVGAFFAESQADVVLSFGRILASITKTVSTRTVPTYTPAVYSSQGFNAGAMTAQFLGSFIPNASKPWSGEIFRERSVCGGTPLQPVAQDPSLPSGDSEAVNLAVQGAANRLFFTAFADTLSLSGGSGSSQTTAIDSSRSIRPFVSSSSDGVPQHRATEVSGLDWNLRSDSNLRLAMQIDKTTCKRSSLAAGSSSGTLQVPALDLDNGEDCTDVVWGFTTAHQGSISKSGRITGGSIQAYEFNARCLTSGTGPSSGKCSISGTTCDVSNPTACSSVPGQVCVPDCAPLGAIFRANPVVNGPPDALLRDPGYRAFQARRRTRKPVLFAATTDGILHAFKAMETGTGAHHELWSFIPPAVLPRLASNYPAGNQILLDGSPVVRDTVWERSVGDLGTGGPSSPGAKWHTTLVAGLGANGGGYYAVNVTDSDCNASPSSITGECAAVTATSGYQTPTPYNLDEAGAGDYDSSQTAPAKRGPHFLFQLTDVPKNSSNDPAKVVRRAVDGTDMVALFGRNTGTPAISTVQLRTNGVDRQVGVAILPGGIDGTPISGGSCARSVGTSDLSHDLTAGYRSTVRKWATACSQNANTLTANAAVPGRGVTIVRLDTGEIVRHFGRRDDIPEAIWNAGKVNPTPFDSPMIGTPVVYPQSVGAIAQKVFIGDADGTLWRIDLADTDPANWKATLFADLIPSSGGAAESQPVSVTPVLSLEPGGALVINATTGDQESIVYRSGEKNYVWSIMEKRPTGTSGPRAQTQWREMLVDGERVTGPMTVFDRTLYFATFSPAVPASNACEQAGTARLWGLNYFVPNGDGAPPGALPMWCEAVSAGGACNSTSLTKYGSPPGVVAGNIIPGVTLRATQACSEIVDLDTWIGKGFSSMTPGRFELSFGVGVPSGKAGFPPSAQRGSVARPLPRVTTTSVNAWALVID